MGATSGASVLHKVSGLSPSEAAAISRGLAAELGADKPRIVADCNNIVFSFSQSTNNVLAAANHLIKWASYGFVMGPVCDGDVCPVCK